MTPDDEEKAKIAMQVFTDMAESGCSFLDAIAAVYQRGREDAGAPKEKAHKRIAVPVCPYVEIVGLFNQVLTPPMPVVKSITQDRMNAGRRRAIAAMWAWVLTSTRSDGTRRAVNSEQGVEWFRGYFERVTHNDFLMGKTAKSGSHANWRCDIDYLMTAAGMKQVLEKTDPT